MGTKETLKERILRQFKPGIGFYELMRLVFPADQFPRAWRYSHNGGPPGGVLAFCKGLSSAGLTRYKNKVVREAS